MKILVIDDKRENLDSATAQLGKDHEVVTASSYDEAEKYLAGSLPHTAANGRWEHVGYDEEYKLHQHNFDVILTDLFMPASARAKVSNQSAGEEPLGLIIALTALRLGIPVAIVSIGGHHANPFLWAMDMIGPDYRGGNPYKIGATPFTFSDDNGSYKNEKGESVKGKSWHLALEKLLALK